jgi:hypothetical protein
MSMSLGDVFRWPLPALLAFFAGIMVAALEVGRLLGARVRASSDADARTYATGLQTAILGLLALLLGFAFSLSASHFVANRDLVTAEANVIETAFRRAELVDEPQRSALKKQLRSYLETRIAYYAPDLDAPRREYIDEKSLAIQEHLWRTTAAAAERSPTYMTALLVDAVNRVIEMHETRVDAARNHIPRVVMWLLLGMAAAGTALTGYVSAFGSGRHRSPTAIIVVLIALVLVAIVDLDRPIRGLTHGGQPSLLKLRGVMAASASPR